jgi:hypothetical protein
LENVVKDAQKQKHLQDTFEKVATLFHFFRRNSKAIDIFNKERLKQVPVPQTMKSFSPTRWNGVSANFTSLRDNKQKATSVIISQQLSVGEARRLPVHVPKSEAGEAAKLPMDGEFWRAVEQFEPLLRLMNITVTFLEGDTVPLSCVTLSFVLIIEPVDHFGLDESVASAVEDEISKGLRP